MTVVIKLLVITMLVVVVMHLMSAIVVMISRSISLWALCPL